MKLLLALSIILGFYCRLEASSVRGSLESIIKGSGLKTKDIGVYAVDSNGSLLFELNGNKHFIPASISKLLTTAAVMNVFSPSHKFHTQIYTDGDRSGFTVKGNIYLKGNGDPAFVSEKMWMLVNDFTREGITKITGDLIADDTYFDNDRFDEGRESERNDRAYDAPVGALSFNWNSTAIFIRPGKASGDQAPVFIDPQNSYVSLKNEVVTSKSGTDVHAERIEKDGGDLVIVKGKIALGAEEHHIYKDISNPPLYAAINFKEFLRQRGVDIAGQVKLGVVPKDAVLVSDFEGEPLSKIILDMNKFSNNYIAEMLAKNLGATKSGKQGTMAEGLEEIKHFLNSDLHWAPDTFALENVSGFTRKNSFTPQQFVEVLTWLEKHFDIFPEFLQSLPIAGTDGTLQKRIKGAQGFVRAKTGLLTGVVALSGFAGTKNGAVRRFAFIYNGSGQEAHVRDVFDSMAAALTAER